MNMNGTQRKSSFLTPRARRTVPIIGLCAALLSSPVLVRGQSTFKFDWSTRPKTAGQTVNAPSISLTTTEDVTFKITNVNDIFYKYGMNCTATAKDGADFSSILGVLIPLQKAEGAPSCDDKAQALLKQIQDYLNTPAACGNNCTSVSVADTTQQISTFIQAIDDALKNCVPSDTWKGQLTSTRDTLNSYLNLNHTVTFDNPISPDQNYTCTVTEYYKQQPTKDGSMVISVQPTNAIVTLSLGPVFSTLQNRTYSAATVPGAGSAGTSTVLAVGGNSISSSIAALVNFRIPVTALAGPKFGLDLAAGPVVRLNSASGTSAAGFFAGISLRFYRYFLHHARIPRRRICRLSPGFQRGRTDDSRKLWHTPASETHVSQVRHRNYLSDQGLQLAGQEHCSGHESATGRSSQGAGRSQASAAPIHGPYFDAGEHRFWEAWIYGHQSAGHYHEWRDQRCHAEP
jgi:hypothetical protein